MKCTKCGIHYDDSDKSCPICGNLSIFNKKTASNIITEDIDGTPRPIPKAPANPHRQPPAGTLSASGSLPNRRKNTGRSSTAGFVVAMVVILAVVCINIVPLFLEDIQTAIPEYAPAATAPETEAPAVDASAEPSSIFSGIWSSDDGNFSLELTANGEFSGAVDGVFLSGYYYDFWYDPEEYDFIYNEAFPSDLYDCYCLALYAQDNDTELGLYLAYFPAETEDVCTLYNIDADSYKDIYKNNSM